jgi:hypothetical protein
VATINGIFFSLSLSSGTLLILTEGVGKVWKGLERFGNVWKCLESFGKVGKLWKDLERFGKVWIGLDMLDRFGLACDKFACDSMSDCVTDNVSTRDATHLKTYPEYATSSARQVETECVIKIILASWYLCTAVKLSAASLASVEGSLTFENLAKHPLIPT